MKEDAINKCQYWNRYEPYQCKYWNADAVVCIYKSIKIEEGADVNDVIVPENAPYCNLLGTEISCSQYESTAPRKYFPRCILPDSRRHVCNRLTGKKWVNSTGATEELIDDYAVLNWSFDVINGYNEGACDNSGTDTTCSGYSPYHLGFGVLQPSSEEDKYDTFKEGRYSTSEEFGYRLPTNFVIYNIRAILSRCYWWKGTQGVFTVNSTTGAVELNTNWLCSSSKDTSKYSEFTLENGPPCNGCKPECPHYTGVCWRYCIDEKMESGDPVLAEQIHELRYYHREHKWTVEAIQFIFIDEGDIFTWSGTKDTGVCGEDASEDCIPSRAATLKGDLSFTLGNEGHIEEYQIPAVKVNMPSFEEFTLQTEDVVLTKGTTITKKVKNYPTLIREIQTLPLSPIIKTKFTKYTDSEEVTTNFFETPYLSKNDKALIYGKVFYDNTTYAINISDKDLRSILPQEIYYYDYIYDIEQDLSVEQFSEFNIRLRAALGAIKAIMPEKVIANLLPETDQTFMMEVPVLFSNNIFNDSNENIVFVWQEVNDYMTYDKIYFTKRLVGGIISQNNFSVKGDAGLTDLPQDYEYDFFAHKNKNGEMSFNFIPFVSEGIAAKAGYMYNDASMASPKDDSDKVYKGHKLYKLTADEYILSDGAGPNGIKEFEIIGSNGYMLIDIDHEYLNSVIKPWEVDNITVLYFVDDDNDSSNDEDETNNQIECEMEIVYHGASGLVGQQQLIVKPKNPQDLSAVCDVWISLKELTYWEKRSYKELPTETEFKSVEETNVNWAQTLNRGELKVNRSSSSGSIIDFTIKNFAFSMTPSMVIYNCQGKPFTQYKTKPIGMVKQPSCPDVEIFYGWKADFIDYQNEPACICCGPWTQVNPTPGGGGWTPSCGDHFQGILQTKGPMWWPYNACLEYENYKQLTNLNNYSMDVIGLFQLKDGEEWVHGSHDMRMLGPHKNYGKTGYGCNSLRACTCDMRTYNSTISGDSVFTGYAKIRGGISTSQLDVWKETDSQLPKFGNAVRSLLRTYRTLDHIPYMDALNERVLWKLMPASMIFSKIDITSDEEEMWDFACTSAGNNVVNPLGFLLAKEFDDNNIDEEIDDYNRFRHEEVFRCKSTVDIEYQKTQGSYVKKRGETVLRPWYEFKRYPVGGGNDFIQWAWQEPWEALERNYFENYNKFKAFVKEYSDNQYVGSIKGTFVGVGLAYGRFLSLDIQYPEYSFDYMNKEFRLIPYEDEYNILFEVPLKDIQTGEYLGYPSFRLTQGSSWGKKRGINWEGVWLTRSNQDGDLGDGNIDNYNVDLYSNSIGDESEEFVDQIRSLWSEQVTLFAPGYESSSKQEAEDDDRMVQTYAETGFEEPIITVKTHFQRGLNVNIISGSLGKLPLRVLLVDQLLEINTNFEVICGITDELEQARYKFDNILRTVGRFSFTFKFGAKLVSPKTKTAPAVYCYYHTPQVFIYKSIDGYSKGELLYETDGMELYNGPSVEEPEIKTNTLEWENLWSYIGNGQEGLIVEFRTLPTDEEIARYELETSISGRYASTMSLVSVIGTTVYEEVLTDAIEYLNIHERKYYVSHGASGHVPPQGANDDDTSERVLTRRRGADKSTVWQNDNSAGVIGVPNSGGNMPFINKVRGRTVFDLYEDETLLTEDLTILESTQKKLYDAAVDVIGESSIMKAVLPPGLKQLLTNAKASFSGPKDLVLKNSLVSKLADINNFPIMNAEGHRYEPGPPSITYCGRVGVSCLDKGLAGDVFKYVYRNLDYKLGDNIVTSDHFVDDPIVQLYSGGAWIIERTMEYEDLMMYVFPARYGRASSFKIWASHLTELYFIPLGLISYGGIIGGSYENTQPPLLDWADYRGWSGILVT